MSFLVIKKWGIFKQLIHTESFYNYGIYFGNIDLTKLNKIYYELTTEIMPFDLATWEKEYTNNCLSKSTYLALNQLINQNPLDLNSQEKLDFMIYHYYCLQSAFNSLIKYLLEEISNGKYNVWFNQFIPYVEVKQLTNNPWSELDPLDDPSINWKFSWKTFCKRNWLNFLVALNLEYKFIEQR